ncbi:DUF2589 domain-containing protein [Massilia sp. CF038]|uniref:DUF2589 domain-containing protein n=1 Tax=Massilia sp. CF038 TaxID=1881045 RepID=UPI0009231B8B|nr:DUF2589 domain-containing protein [Massilia sp. CF038]SHG48515.1 Protein of unknown function [Massilia sp. CF038]
MSELIDMASQFKGLPMGDLIGGPLSAACDAQVKLARATADFIKTIGFMPPDANGNLNETRTAKFSYNRQVPDPLDVSKTKDEKVELDVPLLAIVKVPSLAITKVDITFDMEVKSSFSAKESLDTAAKLTAEASARIGPFSVTVHVEGSIAAHKENTRTSDNSAKYHVQVLAEDSGMPEGLARVLDMMQSAIQPKVSAAPAAKTP